MQPTEPEVGGDRLLPRLELHQRVARKKRELQARNLYPIRLATRADLDMWLVRLRNILTVIRIPQQQWVEAAILFIEDEYLTTPLRLIEDTHSSRTGALRLPWREFAHVLGGLLDARSGQASNLNQASTLQTVLGVGLAVTGVLVAIPVLGAVGFTTRSLARNIIKSAICGGLTKGLISACRSIASATDAPRGSAAPGTGSMSTRAGSGPLAGNYNGSSKRGSEDVPSNSNQESTPDVGLTDEDVSPTSER